MNKTENKKQSTKTANNKKVNAKYETLYTALTTAKCKNDLVVAMLKSGYSTTTKPTTTANVNDLYIQFNDLSRVWLRKNRIDFLSTETTCNALETALKNANIKCEKTIEKSDNGCSKRSHRVECIEKSLTAFQVVFDFLLENGVVQLV